jgi:hypothetical protein
MHNLYRLKITLDLRFLNSVLDELGVSLSNFYSYFDCGLVLGGVSQRRRLY